MLAVFSAVRNRRCPAVVCATKGQHGASSRASGTYAVTRPLLTPLPHPTRTLIRKQINFAFRMSSPAEDETVTEMDVTTNNARNLSDTGVSTVAGAVSVATINQLAVTEDTSWFRRYLAIGALNKVDGVWTRTVQVLTTRKAQVDSVCPIAKAAYVYYDGKVYDAVVTETSTGITYVIQLIFNSETKEYYVYYRWGKTDYKLDGPHDTIDSAKGTFQVTYKEKFDVEWKEREIATSERWTHEAKTYETFEEIEEVEEVVEETQAQLIIAREEETVVEDTKITEHTTTTTTEEVVTIEHETKEETVVVEEDSDPFVLEKTKPLAEGKKGGSAGLSTSALAAVMGASQI